MKLHRLLMLSIASSCLLVVVSERLHAACPNHMLYLIHKGQFDKALEIYDTYFDSSHSHDIDFLQNLGISLLEQGARSSDPETQLMSLFGAGITMNEAALPILARGLGSSVPQLQLIALNFLARCQNDDADKYLQQALRSNYLLVRLEALHQMALKKLPKASNHIESLMAKVEAKLLPLFPQLFALCNDTESTKMLRRLLSHPQESVRIEAIRSCAESGRDDLLPKIRALSTHSSLAEQEACALALGALGDESSIPHLLQLSHIDYDRSKPNVRLAALVALYQMGRQEALDHIQTLGRRGDLFAITALGELPGNEETLALLVQSSDTAIRMNAAIGLLKQHDRRCFPFLTEIFIKDSRDIVFVKMSSQGKGLHYWKPVASGRQQFSDSPVELEISLHLRETLLSLAGDLPEECFLSLTVQLFEKQQNDLIPAAIEILERLQTEKTVDLLTRYLQRPGSPLIRNYCNLALYRLGEKGPYSANLATWLEAQASEDLIQLRPLVPWEMDDTHETYTITPHETSRLLIESFEALTKKQDNHGISCLLKAIKTGNSKNKYALAGLLIRATL